MCVIWCIHMCDMTHPYMWRDVSMWLPFIHMMWKGMCLYIYTQKNCYAAFTFFSKSHMVKTRHMDGWSWHNAYLHASVAHSCVTCMWHESSGGVLCTIHCNTMQHTVSHCNTLQHTASHCNTLQHTATHCNTLQHTAIHCNTLQCNTLQHTATHWISLQFTAIHCKMTCMWNDALGCGHQHSEMDWLIRESHVGDTTHQPEI